MDFIVLAVSLIISTSAVLAYSIFFTENWSEGYIKRQKKEKQATEKKLLKDHVNVIESLIDFHYKKLKDENTIKEYHERHMKNVINVAYTMLQLKVQSVKEGKMTQQKAQEQAIKDIKQIRYDGKKYVWINDTAEPPKMIMHPFKTSLNDMSDPKHHKFVTELMSIIKQNGEGFFEMPKPASLEDSEKKPASLEDSEKKRRFYVKLFRDWNWIIGTRIFVNDLNYIKNDLKNELKNAIRKMRYNDGKRYFWIVDFSDRKSPKYVMHPIDPKRENQELTGPFRKYKRRVESFIDICNEKEGDQNKNYIEYKADKLVSDGLFIQGAPKLTYVRCYEPLHWVIGSGFFKEDIERNIKKNEKYLNKKFENLMKEVLIFAAIAIFFLVMFNYTINLLRGGTKDIKNSSDA